MAVAALVLAGPAPRALATEDGGEEQEFQWPPADTNGQWLLLPDEAYDTYDVKDVRDHGDRHSGRCPRS